MCWAYDVDEGELEGIYWSRARREIQLKIQLKLGTMIANALATHSALVNVISGALGGSKTSSGPSSDRTDLAAGHSDVDSAVAAINRAMRF